MLKTVSVTITRRARAVRVLAQRAFEKFQIAMRINDFRRARKPHAVDQARVVSRIRKNRVARPQQGTEQPDVGGVARAEIKRRFGPRELRELSLDLFPLAGIARKQPRARRSNAPRARNRLDRRLFESRIDRKPEVIIRAEIQSTGAVQYLKRTKLRLVPQRIEFARDPLVRSRVGARQALCIAFMPRFSSNCWSASAPGIRRGQQLLARENGIRAREKAERHRLGDIRRRPAASRTREAGIRIRAVAIARTITSGSSSSTSAERRARVSHQHVDRHAFRVRIEARELVQQPDAVLVRFAHAQNSAAAHGDARPCAHARSSRSRSSYTRVVMMFAVKFRRRIEIVVVSRKPGVLQPLRLRFGQHAERAADFHIERRHAAHHLQHALELLRRPSPAATPRPCRIASRLRSSRVRRPRAPSAGFISSCARHVRLVVRALRAVGAILGAPARLDRKQAAELHFVWPGETRDARSAPEKSAREAAD